MKKTVLLLCLILGGCGTVETETKIQPNEEVVEEEKVEQKVKYPTLESYASAIVFKDGVRFEGDPREDIFYDEGIGIKSFNIAKFYNYFKEREDLLERQREILAEVVLMKGVKQKEPEDPIFDFMANKGGWYYSEEYVEQAQKNKNQLKKLNQKFNKDWKSMSLEELEQLIILAEENGDYVRVKKIVKFKCKKFPESCKNITLNISGWVRDDAYEVVPDLKIEVLNDPSLGLFTSDATGYFSFDIQARPYQLVRLRFSALGYMPLLKETQISSYKSKYNMVYEFELPKAKDVHALETKDLGDIETQKGSVFGLKPNVLESASGEAYQGAVTAYFYDFDPRETDMTDMLRGSVRMSGGGVVSGFLLQSYGMPYASFTDDKGEELIIRKKNAIPITTTSSNPDLLYQEYRQPDQTKEEFWDYWISYSQKTKDFTPMGQKMDLPSYWVYNIDNGVWEEVPTQVIAPGVFSSIFYTHN